jgi:low temperature requirement protein LtrA
MRSLSEVVIRDAGMSSDRNLLRTRAEHEHSRVTFVELFFDVVFVFAVTQLVRTGVQGG